MPETVLKITGEPSSATAAIQEVQRRYERAAARGDDGHVAIARMRRAMG